ncbi:MAG: ATP-grasp domain-containing protein [Ignavibacteria bacterium]|nr:ATP-grasp domain-containing protein [Ignavibacteria bacterium]
METINAIRDAIAEVHDVVMVEADRSAYQKLAENSPDFAFNVSEGLHGVSREAQIPGMLEMLQIPYLGSNPLTLATCLDKARTKEVLTYHRVPTPAFSVAHRREDVDDLRVRFPSIVKPLHEGSSKGIYNSCVVRSPEELIREVVTVLDTYHQPALIEEFLPGREFTVAVMGNGREAYCLPIVEINYDVFPVGVNPVYSYEAKWVWDTPGNPLEIFRCPAEIDQDLQSRVERIVLDSYRILGCRDWSRIDVRLDRNGIPNIIEVNPLPGVLPKVEDNSCFPKAARAVGLSYNALIQTVLNIALARTGILVPVAEKPAAVTA